jgi:hypothetical protein
VKHDSRRRDGRAVLVACLVAVLFLVPFTVPSAPAHGAGTSARTAVPAGSGAAAAGAGFAGDGAEAAEAAPDALSAAGVGAGLELDPPLLFAVGAFLMALGGLIGLRVRRRRRTP